MGDERPTHTTSEFFAALYGGLHPPYVLVIFTIPGQRATFCTSTEKAAKTALAKKDVNVYFGICPLGEKPASGRGTEKDVRAVTCFWCDIDVTHAKAHAQKKHAVTKTYAPDFETAHALLKDFELEPTIVVHSGHGLQAYWCLKDPLLITDDDARRRAAQLSQAVNMKLQVKARLRQFDVDSTHDLARIFRVPGTLNVKCKPYIPVKILELHPETRYTVEEIETNVQKYIAKDEQKAGAIEPRKPLDSQQHAVEPGPHEDGTLEIPIAVNKLLAHDQQFRKTWNRERTDLKDRSASGYDMAIANALVRDGCDDQTIANALYIWRMQHGEKPGKLYRKQTVDGRTYLSDTIAKARAQEIASEEQMEAISKLESVITKARKRDVRPIQTQEEKKTPPEPPIAKEGPPGKSMEDTGEQKELFSSLDNVQEERELVKREPRPDDPIDVEVTREPKISEDGAAMLEREEAFRSIQDNTGLPITGMEKVGHADNARYFLVFEHGQKCLVGSETDFKEQNTLRFRIMAHVYMAMKLMEAGTWAGVCELLHRYATVVESGESSFKSQGQSYVEQYLYQRRLFPAKEWLQALPESEPFQTQDGEIAVSSLKLQNFLKNLGVVLTKNQLKDCMHASGFCNRKVEQRVDGKHVNRYYWFGHLENGNGKGGQ